MCLGVRFYAATWRSRVVSCLARSRASSSTSTRCTSATLVCLRILQIARNSQRPIAKRRLRAAAPHAQRQAFQRQGLGANATNPRRVRWPLGSLGPHPDWRPPALYLFVFVLGGSVEAALRPLTTRDSTSLSLFLLCWILPELSHLHLIDRLDCRSHNITARAVMFETMRPRGVAAW